MHSGTVKYSGPVEGLGAGIFFGVELSEPSDEANSGEFLGQKYFECSPNRGLFIKFN